MSIRLAFIAVLATAVTACGGNDTPTTINDPAIQTGVFLDSAVQGLRYRTNSLNGETDSAGRFSYTSGETVSFYIGDILLGSTTAKAIVTPLDLVPGATNETDPTVTNLLRFLQSLDSDGDASNGISLNATVIANAAGQTINFNQSISNFEMNVQDTVDFLFGGSRPMVSATEAQAHFRDTLIGIATEGSNGGNDGSGGSGDPGVGDFGSLTLSGADTAVIGGSFQANYSSELVAYNVTGITWAAGLGRGLAVIAVGETPAAVSLTIVSPNDLSQYYAYKLDCEATPTPTECANISIDTATRTASFSNLTIPVDTREPTPASAAITLTGTLNWQAAGP